MFQHLQAILRLTRAKAYSYTLFSIIAVICLIAPQDLLSIKTALVFLANLFLTAFVYAFNDVEDASDDYTILEKRLRNPITNGDLSVTKGYLISFALLSIGLFILSLIGPLASFFGLVLGLIGFLYSWRPVRLKSIPYADLISHILCLGVLQFLMTYSTFRPIDVFTIPFLMIIIPFSLMVEVLFELRDFGVDRETNVKNTIQRLGRFGPKKLLVASGAIAVAGFVIIFLAIPFEYKIAVLFSSLLLAILIASKVNSFLKANCLKASNRI